MHLQEPGKKRPKTIKHRIHWKNADKFYIPAYYDVYIETGVLGDPKYEDLETALNYISEVEEVYQIYDENGIFNCCFKIMETYSIVHGVVSFIISSAMIHEIKNERGLY